MDSISLTKIVTSNDLKSESLYISYCSGCKSNIPHFLYGREKINKVFLFSKYVDEKRMGLPMHLA